MKEAISIGTNTMPGLVYSKLSDMLQVLNKDGLPVDLDIDTVGDFTFMGYKVKKSGGYNKEEFELIKNTIANCLADIIIDEWETRIVSKIVRENYFYYTEEDKATILRKAKESLYPNGLKSFGHEQRREKILKKVRAYLDLNKELILEGFINFRLKDYQNELEEIVSSAVDEFMMEKEYLEFIRLLKYFVDIQEPRVEKIIIIFRKSGKFNLYDADDNPFKHECLDGLMVDLLENEINYDDLLISALITLAPRQIEVHMEEGVSPGETMKTIDNVFGKRVKHCDGCARCRPSVK